MVVTRKSANGRSAPSLSLRTLMSAPRNQRRSLRSDFCTRSVAKTSGGGRTSGSSPSLTWSTWSTMAQERGAPETAYSGVVTGGQHETVPTFSASDVPGCQSACSTGRLINSACSILPGPEFLASNVPAKILAPAVSLAVPGQEEVCHGKTLTPTRAAARRSSLSSVARSPPRRKASSR